MIALFGECFHQRSLLSVSSKLRIKISGQVFLSFVIRIESQIVESWIWCTYNDRFGKKEYSDHCRVMVERKQYWSLKSQVQDVYELNIVNMRWDKLKFRITRSNLVTFSSSISPRLKSPKIKILCCDGSSLINK